MVNIKGQVQEYLRLVGLNSPLFRECMVKTLSVYYYHVTLQASLTMSLCMTIILDSLCMTIILDSLCMAEDIFLVSW